MKLHFKSHGDTLLKQEHGCASPPVVWNVAACQYR